MQATADIHSGGNIFASGLVTKLILLVATVHIQNYVLCYGFTTGLCAGRTARFRVQYLPRVLPA